MKARTIDYTKLRLGSIVCQWQYKAKDGTTKTASTKIEKCPKCGRKGEKKTYFAGKPNAHFMFTHKSEVSEVIPGFPLNSITDHCTVPMNQVCMEATQ